MSRKLLGEILVERGIIDKETLEKALQHQKDSGRLLGEILISQGMVHPVTLYEVLAEQGNLLYAGKDLQALLESIDASLLENLDPGELLRLALFPRRIQDGVLEVLTPFPENHDQDRWCAEHFPGVPVIKALITPYELDWLLHFFFKDRFLAEATTGLFFRSPEESAASVLVPWQWGVLVAGLFALLFGVVFAPQSTLRICFAVVNLLFFANVLFKTLVGIAGATPLEPVEVTESEIAALDPRTLPVYTILLPLHREPKVVITQLVASIRALDYPQEKLDILFLIEEDDTETLKACKEAHPPYNVRFILIPRGEPKTKPRACNFGLAFARGEFLTIYDAEDIPEKDQLKKAVVTFSKLPRTCICLQAALNFYNPTQNILTRLFTLEYSFWFDYLLPGLFRLRFPIPLGERQTTSGPKHSGYLADGTPSTSPRMPIWACAPTTGGSEWVSSPPRRTKRRTAASGTGFASVPAGSKGTCRRSSFTHEGQGMSSGPPDSEECSRSFFSSGERHLGMPPPSSSGGCSLPG